MTLRTLFFILLILTAGSVFAGCTSPSAGVTVATAQAPGAGKADGSDIADRSCRVVLREVARPPASGLYETNCETESGACFFVFAGTVDVSEAFAAGASVGVLFSSTWQPGWFEVAAVPVDPTTLETPVEDGFVRFEFRLDDKTMAAGASAGAIQRTKISLIPFVRTGGARHFDHNRLPGDFETYVVEATNGFSVADEGAICRAEPAARSALEFTPGFEELLRGPLVAGGEVTVHYDLSRLPECRDTHNGFPAWDTVAHVRFEPSGATVQRSVRVFEAPFGSPTNVAHTSPYTLRIPGGTDRLAIWFENSSLGGATCQTWDSEFGTNYAFDVLPAAPAPVGWAEITGGSWSRECNHAADAIADPAEFSQYTSERACTFIDTDVYVPGLTDADALHPEWIVAEVEWALDDGETRVDPLSFEERVDNNYRFRWTLPRSEMAQATWSTLSYVIRLSTDGREFLRIGRDDGAPREVHRVTE